MRKSSRRQPGQGLSEYAVILGLVALASIIVLGLIGLAISRQYGLVAGILGTRKDVQGSPNHVYFDTNPPQCGTYDGQKTLYMQFFSDIDKLYLSASTENGNIPLEIEENGSPPPGSGTGNLRINSDLPANVPCPLAVVIQSDKDHAGVTVVWNVLQKDWD